MKSAPFKSLLACAGLLLSLTACTTTLEVHKDYVAAGIAQPVAKGHASLVIAEADRKQVFNGHPTSLTGAATSVTLPLGEVVATVGEKVCTAYFTDGATVGASAKPGDYVVSATPKSFSYKYDQLSNLGFAVTPKVSVAVSIGVKAPDGTVIVPEKTFERTDFSATGAYLISLQPPEKINQSLHTAVADIFREALDQLPKK
jgi:hypothetical protein